MTAGGGATGSPGDRLRGWLGRSIGNRITAAAVTVTMLVATTIGALSYAAVRLLLVQNIRTGLEHDATLIEQQVRLELGAIVDDLTGLSTNSFIANGLVDSLGRDTYLLPFLREHHVPGEATVEITLCDFRGVPVATNRDGTASLPPRNASVAGALTTGRPAAEILTEGGTAALLLSVPVVFPPTGQAEGVLVGKIRLLELFADELSSLGDEYRTHLLAAQIPVDHAPRQAEDLIRTVREFRLPAPIDAIAFRLEVGELRGAALGPLRHVTLLFLLVGLVTILAVFQLTRAATRRLVLPLAALSRTAAEIAESGSLDARAAVSGSNDEIGALATSFNTMLTRLQESSDTLELRVVERTRELRASEAALAEVNRTLEQRVEEETALRLEQERMLVLQSRQAAMGEMIGAIAHQWRQPLNTVGAIVQDIRDAQAHGELSESYLARAVENAMEQIRFMSKTIDDFRNFFRPEKEKRPFDAKLAAAEVLRMLSSQLLKHRISFRLTCHTHQRTYVDFATPIVSCGEMQLVGYENELKQVFLNLLGNAQDAILERRERLREAPGGEERGLVALDFERAGDRIVIRVTDNGGGIPAHAVDRVFEPYFTTKGQGRGTGIGLYMSKMIIENSMGGRLTARNVDGGAEFRIEV